MEYIFTGATMRFYQHFVAQPGEVVFFADPADVPTDGMWLPYEAPVSTKAAKATPSQENKVND